MKRNHLIGTALAAGALLLAGCTSGGDTEPTTAPSDQPLNLTAYQQQEITWGRCSDDIALSSGAECATMKVPATYDVQSDLPDVTLQLLRLPAKDDASRRGVMLVNPGGPGSSGTSFATEVDWPAEIRDTYDIIGFDPRGTGLSDPVYCADGADYYEALYTVESTPRDLEEWTATDQAESELLSACVEEHPYWWTMTTDNTVADMDLIRQVLGEDTINYYGASYGTWLGAEYIDAYPAQSDRFVLDSPSMSYTKDGDADELEQMAAIEDSIRVLAERCAKDESCQVGATTDEVLEFLAQALSAADDGAIVSNLGVEQAPGGGTLPSERLMVDGLIIMTYLPAGEIYPQFRSSVNQLAGGDSSQLEFLGLLYHDVDLDTRERSSNILDAFEIYSCMDKDETSTVAEDQEFQEELAEVAPFIAQISDPHRYTNSDDPQPGCGYSYLALADESIPDPPAVQEPPANAGDPVLLVGTTGDNATPYADAEAMAEALDSVLVTIEGTGHAQGLQNRCARSFILDYLVDGVLPAENPTCS